MTSFVPIRLAKWCLDTVSVVFCGMKPAVLLFLLLPCTLLAQSLTQTIRGRVTDKTTKTGLPDATVVVLGTQTGAVTDREGYFRLDGVPVGRQTLRVSYVGYREIVLTNLIVNSAKELVVQAELEESVVLADEVVIKAKADKAKPINELAAVSARVFTVEETSRYAGAFMDPARLVTNFAGAQNPRNDRNDVVVRGNSPLGVLWRLEGVDIPNPNHFAFLGSSGGISILNTNTLANSDFLTGAFPAEYGNRTAAAFDLNLRTGNNDRYEYTGQAGIGGLEFGIEGPVQRKKHSSFMANYRTFSLKSIEQLGVKLAVTGGLPDFQDLTFKVNLPSEKWGSITLFGLGGKSTYHERDDTGARNDLGSGMGVVGLTHLYHFSPKTYGKLYLSWSGSETTQQDFNTSQQLTQDLRMNYQQLQGRYEVVQKFTARDLIKGGVTFNRFYFDFLEKRYSGKTVQTRFNDQSQAALWQSYVHWQHRFNDRLTMNSGLYFQHFGLNNTQRLEPRWSLQWQATPQHRLSLGYGSHSQTQPLAHYTRLYTYTNRPSQQTNRGLGFTKSQHLVLSHDWSFHENWRLKTELYYQSLYDVPVTLRPSPFFSTINTGTVEQGVLNIPDSLLNAGTGYNTGIEFTLEKFFRQRNSWEPHYLLATLSVFRSRYQGTDHIWRNTAFGNQYVLNLLAGYEWAVGRARNNALLVDVRFSATGGKPYIPVDLAASVKAKSEVRDTKKAYLTRLAPYQRIDLKTSFRFNRPKVNHYLFVELTNLLSEEVALTVRYDNSTKSVKTQYYGFKLLPLAGYRISWGKTRAW